MLELRRVTDDYHPDDYQKYFLTVRIDDKKKDNPPKLYKITAGTNRVPSF